MTVNILIIKKRPLGRDFIFNRDAQSLISLALYNGCAMKIFNSQERLRRAMAPKNYSMASRLCGDRVGSRETCRI